MKFFVINLRKDTKRKQYMLNLLRKHSIDFSFFPAIIPSEKDTETFANSRRSKRKIGRALQSAEVGCAMSHLGIYRHMQDNNIDKAVIFEDDIILENKFTAILADIKKFAPENWELILLGYGGECGNQRICHKKIRTVKSKENNFVFTKPLNITWSTFAYMITLRGARKLLETIKTGNGIDRSIDGYTGDYRLIDLYCVKPPCASHANFGSSVGYRWQESERHMKISRVRKILSYVKFYVVCCIKKTLAR